MYAIEMERNTLPIESKEDLAAACFQELLEQKTRSDE